MSLPFSFLLPSASVEHSRPCVGSKEFTPEGCLLLGDIWLLTMIGNSLYDRALSFLQEHISILLSDLLTGVSWAGRGQEWWFLGRSLFLAPCLKLPFPATWG